MKLEPCANCGGEAETHNIGYLETAYATICKGCSNNEGQWFETEEEASQNWNKKQREKTK